MEFLVVSLFWNVALLDTLTLNSTTSTVGLSGPINAPIFASYIDVQSIIFPDREKYRLSTDATPLINILSLGQVGLACAGGHDVESRFSDVVLGLTSVRTRNSLESLSKYNTNSSSYGCVPLYIRVLSCLALYFL